MKQVTRYETADGALFNTEAEAVDHERLCAIQDWYDNHRLYSCNSGYPVTWPVLVTWLRDHSTVVSEILKVENARHHTNLPVLNPL